MLLFETICSPAAPNVLLPFEVDFYVIAAIAHAVEIDMMTMTAQSSDWLWISAIQIESFSQSDTHLNTCTANFKRVRCILRGRQCMNHSK